MANPGAAPATASQIGSYFVQQYYQVFQQQQDYLHQFYTDESSMIRVDGEISHSASDMMEIHQLLMSLDFAGVEIKTINSLESWNGGVLVVVSGSAKSRKSIRWKKFMQTFFLAPQEKGYFVLNDMFHFGDEEVANQPLAPALQKDPVNDQPTTSSHTPKPPVSDYALKGTTREYVDSVDIEEDEPDQEYSYQEQDLEHYHQETKPESKPDTDILKEEIPIEESSAFHHNISTAVPDAQFLVDEESAGEPEKLTYASILRAKGKSSASISYSPGFTQSAPAPVPVPAPHASDWNYTSTSLQLSNPSALNSGFDVAEEVLPQDEGESKSVYVRNLPSTVTMQDILHEFRNFGKIINDGVFLKNRKDTGVCYAFVEYEDLQGVHNALKASPVLLCGRQVYVEERRPNSGPSRGGRARGRGRGGFGGRSFGRGGS